MREPTEDDLFVIRNWHYRKPWFGLMEFVNEFWIWPFYTDYKKNGNIITWELSTGGWSDHETIIEALTANQMFWTLCWQSSSRGGNYVFRWKEEK